MSLKAQDPHGEKETAGIGRRRFLNAAAALGIGSVALAGCKEDSPKNAPAGAAGAPAGAAPEHDAHVGGAGTTEVKPGQLDTSMVSGAAATRVTHASWASRRAASWRVCPAS